MYWPTSSSRVFPTPSPLQDEPILRTKPSRKGNFFATITATGLGIWDVRPTVLQAAVIRTPQSIERWGTNIEVFWASDGRGIIVLTSTSHLLFYQLSPTSRPSYDTPPTTNFPGGGGPGEGDILMGWTIRSLGAAFVMGGCERILTQPHSLLITMRHPPSILSVPYPLPSQLLSPAGSHFPPAPLDGEGEEQVECDVWDMTKAEGWIEYTGDSPPVPRHISAHRTHGLPALYTLSTDDGRVYAMYSGAQVASLTEPSIEPTAGPSTSTPLPPHQASPVSYFPKLPSSKYTGHLMYPLSQESKNSKLVDGIAALGLLDEPPLASESPSTQNLDKATEVAINSKFGLVAIGTEGGHVNIIATPPYPQRPRWSHSYDLKESANLRISPGKVTSLAWTSDGYALAVGYEKGWAVWSMGGRLGGWGVADAEGEKTRLEGFMDGVIDLFWAPGNVELFVLAQNGGLERNEQLYAIPFAKSATTGQHSPDNTRYAFLQMDDRVLVYRGADQPDMSVINPESDVWQHIKIPNAYIATNWPIRYASISNDGKLIAVAGRWGLTHYSSSSGRWKLFVDEDQEKSFSVRGGLLWFHHVLIVAVEANRSYQIRLYSRDLDLAENNILHSQILPSPILVMSLLDNSLLVYTADNTLYHFVIVPTKDTIKTHLCGSISFQGIVQVPSRVRALSWLIPEAQKQLGDPADDLIVATIIFLVDGKLVLLRPRRAGNDEILADRIEAYWTHLHGVGTLENSLWGYDGKGMRIWLDALTIEATRVDSLSDAYESVEESVHLQLDFYPLSILMDKGIIIGVDYETSTRSLPFSLFKIQTSTHLFLPPFLRYHLQRRHLHHALTFATNYSSIVYFAHALEILLHSVLEEEVDTGLQILPSVITFLDYFPEALDVVVGCARKTEIERWEMLFDVVGQPRELFEKCLEAGMLRTAASYLLVLQNLEALDDARDTIRLLRLAIAAKEFHLCKELLRFLHSIDESGEALRSAIDQVGLVPASKPRSPQIQSLTDTNTMVSSPDLDSEGEATIKLPSVSVLAPATSVPASPEVLQQQQQRPSPTRSSSGRSLPKTSPSPSQSNQRPKGMHSPASSLSASSASGSPGPSPTRAAMLRQDSADRVTSPFQLSSPRLWTSPPSPRTVINGDQVDQPLIIPE